MNPGASAPGNPAAFSARSGLLLVAVGAALFLALLWMIGTGNGFTDTNDGGGHGGGKGLNGFAGLVRLAQARGWDTTLARGDADLNQPGLLVLTPTANAPGKEIARIVNRHRRIGPVIVIAPKWLAQKLAPPDSGGKDGWVSLIGTEPPQWPGFLDKVTVALWRGNTAQVAAWRAAGISGCLPAADVDVALTGGGEDDAGNPLVPIVELAAPDSQGQMLAAYVRDARPAPALQALTLRNAGALPGAGADQVAGPAPDIARPSSDYPLVLVFEPDLLDNYGLNDPANVALAEQLLAAAAPDGPRAAAFDLTLDGLGHSPNLLTLAFTPPYLAATLCLIFAALAGGAEGFCRFGAARPAARDLDFGKRGLVANGGALILRARRLHLLGAPYVAAARERVSRALALPRGADAAETEAAIDRAIGARRAADAASQPGFAQTAQRLQQARGEAAIVEAALALHRLERMLMR
jgi:hypothetical protein